MDDGSPPMIPEFLSVFRDVVVCPGQFAIIECHIIGSPIPEITWLINNELPDPTRHQVMKHGTHSILVVKVSGPDDEAEILCIASNDEGLTSWSARLHVAPEVEVSSGERKMAEERDQIALKRSLRRANAGPEDSAKSPPGIGRFTIMSGEEAGKLTSCLPLVLSVTGMFRCLRPKRTVILSPAEFSRISLYDLGAFC